MLFDQPTRIVVNGYPQLEGETLLEMRRCAREKHDDIRQRLMREPRGQSFFRRYIFLTRTSLIIGHTEMYGAILIA
ncbi:hypothetical protein B0H14DRAFT_3035214, partial [Mycena olivaceomarginata]